MDTEAGRYNNAHKVRSTIPKIVAIPMALCIIHYMTNRILLQKAVRLVNGNLLVPFSCSDIGTMHLHESRQNRTDAENAMVDSIHARIHLALSNAGYQLEGISFTAMRLTVKPINPVK